VGDRTDELSLSGAEDWSYGDWRDALTHLSGAVGEWQGIPLPVDQDEIPVRLHDRHPLAEVFGTGSSEIELLVGGPDLNDGEDEEIVNRWYDGRHNRDVFIMRRLPSGRAFALTCPRSPDQSMDRLMFWVRTIGASDAWSLAAETAAMEKLFGLVSERQFRHYCLTGSFLETSPRSRLTYVFRRLRPTIALTPRWKYGSSAEGMRCLAVLCLHPIGYYDRTWGGCMVPTDDVIAHLLTMRADEAYFWRKANQHEPSAPEAGL